MMKTPRVEQYAHRSPSWYVCRRTYLHLCVVREFRLTPRHSDAQLHIVTDNKATSVTTGSTLFFPEEEDVRVLTPEHPRSSGLLGGHNTFRHICYQNPQPGCSLPSWAFHCRKEIRASVHSLPLLPPKAPYGWFGRFSSTCLRLFASKMIWKVLVSRMFVETNWWFESSFLLQSEPFSNYSISFCN